MNQTKTYDELLIELFSYYSDLQTGKNPAMVRLDCLNLQSMLTGIAKDFQVSPTLVFANAIQSLKLKPESSLTERCSFVAGMCSPVGTEKFGSEGFRQKCVSLGYDYTMVEAGYHQALSQHPKTLQK